MVRRSEGPSRTTRRSRDRASWSPRGSRRASGAPHHEGLGARARTASCRVARTGRAAPLPLAGRGWGWGARRASRSAGPHGLTPTPCPSPQGGGEVRDPDRRCGHAVALKGGASRCGETSTYLCPSCFFVRLKGRFSVPACRRPSIARSGGRGWPKPTIGVLTDRLEKP